MDLHLRWLTTENFKINYETLKGGCVRSKNKFKTHKKKNNKLRWLATDIKCYALGVLSLMALFAYFYSLLKIGYNINQQDELGFSPLHLASLLGRNIIIRYIIVWSNTSKESLEVSDAFLISVQKMNCQYC